MVDLRLSLGPHSLAITLQDHVCSLFSYHKYSICIIRLNAHGQTALREEKKKKEKKGKRIILDKHEINSWLQEAR